jgi:hypothetical protein
LRLSNLDDLKPRQAAMQLADKIARVVFTTCPFVKAEVTLLLDCPRCCTFQYSFGFIK